ncbi:obscurin-like protein 1 isoform X3 [Synchiropus splendidus]|uniref:obscurin-like protein 1 isoform X3 n=1 Tax=Synchiropus splendidus TaxID=270530 RepID=UPI00237D80B9|nr:obscurin-like protein 1 isoform X3 [Synchiropus splendidus]
MDVFGGAPRFFAYPRPVVVQSGTDAVLKCQIGGDPRPAVIWERNNEKLDPQGRYRVFEDGNVYNLIISSVTIEDSGQYICKAKNCIGETYAAATLKVEGEAQEMELREENKPRFLIKPLSTRAGRGEDAVFSCKLWGNPRPEVVWEKDGRKLNEIFESTHFSVSYQDGGWFHLKIFKTRAPDGGVYTCKARNEYGEALAGAVLLVDAGPGHEDDGTRNGYTNGHWKSHQGKQRTARQLSNRLKDDTVTKSTRVKMFAVTEGKHAKFRCFVTGKPKPEIIWRKDGRLILSGRRYLLYEDREGYFTLKVLYCKQKDNGVYVCAASNTAGQTLSAVHLSVKEPPVRFKQPLIDLEVWERDLAVLECEVPEDSVPITWYLEDRRLQPGAKYGMEEWGTKRRLTIRDIGVDDDGIYLCEMPDGGRSIAEVAVKGTITRKLPRKVDVLEGENAAFCVEVEKEEMDIHWYKDGAELRETHQTILKSFGRTHILVFVNTMPQDSGLVTFLVGRSKTSSQLRVKAAKHCPPSCPVGVQINTERANAALLSWVPAQDSRKNPPSGYVLERQEVGTGSQEWLQCLTTDTATSVEILGDSVPCEADYRFRICSVNKYGKSNNVEFPRAVHLVPVARIQAPLQDALVPEGQDAVFSIELSASVIGSWFLNGTQLQEDERYSMRRSRTHQSLRIQGVRDSDNGAEITFIAYGIRDSAALYIQAPLVKFSPLSEMDRNKFVEIGNPIVLYCELSDPVAPVHWYKNGVELSTKEGLHIQSEGTMRRIVIQSAELSHSGVYCCDAIDDVIRFNVEVEAPPVKIFDIPENMRIKSIEEGRPVVLQCEVSDPAGPVCWYKDEILLATQPGFEISSEGRKRILVIERAQLVHSGLYRCSTKDDTVDFQVEIKALPVIHPTMAEIERIKSLDVGKPLVMEYEAVDTTVPVFWHKDGEQIFPSKEWEIQRKSTLRRLVIPSAELLHSGIYHCETPDDSVRFTVDIKAPPLPLSPSLKVTETPSLESTTSSEPSPRVSDSPINVSWEGDSPVRDFDLEHEANKKTLVVEPTHPSTAKEYYCATADDVTQLTVKNEAPPARFSELPETDRNKAVQEGSDVVLSCELARDPLAQVCWYKDGEKLLHRTDVEIQSDGLRRTLVIPAAQSIHSGLYRCSTADDSITFTVDVKAREPQIKPVPLSEKYKMISVGSPIMLQCEVTDPVAQVSWFKDRVELFCKTGLDMKRDGNLRKLMIHSAKVSDSGLYSCNLADDVVTFHVDIQAPPVTFADLPKEELFKCVVEKTELALSCEVSRADGVVQWYKDGAEIHQSSNISIKAEDMKRSLTIHSPQLSDTGMYTCRAGDNALMFKVYIREPPVMIIYPKEDVHLDRHVPEEIILSCELSRPNGVVSWFKDGQKLQESENIKLKIEGPYRRLKIISSGVEDSGEYVCDTADDSIFFHLNITEPPVRIVSPSQSQMELCQQTSERMVLSCEISRPNAVVRWYRDGLEVEENDNLILEVDGVYRRLIIPETTVKDSAEYVCDTADDSVTFFVNIAEPPVRFVRPRKMASRVEKTVGDCLVLDCEVSRANAVVVWKRNGEEVEDSRKVTIFEDGVMRQLTIHSVTVEDAGQYICDAKDDVMDFHVKVQEMKVKIIRPLENIVSVKGKIVTLRCEINKPKGDVQWLKDGQEVTSNRHHTIRAQGRERSLTIHELVEEDGGEYACETTDDRTTATVTVETPRVVEFIAELRNITVCEGEDAVFKCVVSPEDTELVWRLNGEAVAPSERTVISNNGLCHMLCIHNCIVSDSGRVTADAEGLVSEAELQVQEQQVLFTKKMTPLIAEEYSEATLEVEVSVDSGEVQWMRQGVLIHPGAKYTPKHQGRKRSLTIHKLTMSDRGTYSCESLHDRTQAQLTVEPRKVAIKKGLTDIRTTERETATFEVELSHPNVPGAWMRNGIKLKPTNDFRMSAKGQVHSLTISNLSVEDTGTFVFSVENLKTTARLVVKEPPVAILRKLEDQQFPEGAIISIECELSRHNVDVKWMKNGDEVKPGKDLRIYAMGRKRFLQKMKCQVSDSGMYTCDAGDVATSCAVEVYERELVILHNLEDLSLQEDQNAVFVCEVSVEDVPGEWYKHGELIQQTSTIKIRQEGTKHFLLMCNVRPEDSGEIKFVARDLESVAHLDVEELPVNIVKPLQDRTALEKSRVMLDCTVSNPRSSIRWYKGCNVVLPSERFEICSEGCFRKLVIQQVALDDEGTYSVQVGDYSCSAKLTVEAQASLMVRELQDVEVVAPNDACFECEVSVPVLKSPTWTLNGEPLQPSSRVLLEKMGTVHRLTLRQTSADMSGVMEFTSGRAKSRAELRVMDK